MKNPVPLCVVTESVGGIARLYSAAYYFSRSGRNYSSRIPADYGSAGQPSLTKEIIASGKYGKPVAGYFFRGDETPKMNWKAIRGGDPERLAVEKLGRQCIY